MFWHNVSSRDDTPLEELQGILLYSNMYYTQNYFLCAQCWVLETYFVDSQLAKVLQIGDGNNAMLPHRSQVQGEKKIANILNAEVNVDKDET